MKFSDVGTCLLINESFSNKILYCHPIQKSRTVYPNTPETLLPNWCKGDKNDDDLARFPGYTNSDKARRWVAKRYAMWWVPDDYTTSGVNIFNQVHPAQVH